MLGVLRNREVCEMLGVSPATLWRWTRHKNFPAPIQLGPNSVGWIEAEINDWIAARAAERNSQPEKGEV